MGLLETLVGAPLRVLAGAGKGTLKGARFGAKITSKKGIKEIGEQLHTIETKALNPVTTMHELGERAGDKLTTIPDKVDDYLYKNWTYWMGANHLSKQTLPYKVLGTADAVLMNAESLVLAPFNLVGKGLGYVTGTAAAGASAAGTAAVRSAHNLAKLKKIPLPKFGEDGLHFEQASLYGLVGQTAGNVARVTGRTIAGEAANVGKGVVNTGKFMWKTRNSKVMQTTYLGLGLTGAAAYGMAKGTPELYNGTVLPFDQYSMTFTRPQQIHNVQNLQVPGSSFKSTVDNMNASGDLVFALNNLRNGGIL